MWDFVTPEVPPSNGWQSEMKREEVVAPYAHPKGYHLGLLLGKVVWCQLFSVRNQVRKCEGNRLRGHVSVR